VDETLKDFDTHLEECLGAGAIRLVIDIAQVPFIDSAGLERLQQVVSDLGRHGGDLRVAAPNDICSDIFLATRMENFVQVLPDKEAAIGSLL
jgi:anti-sigma B factor antagonist